MCRFEFVEGSSAKFWEGDLALRDGAVSGLRVPMTPIAGEVTSPTFKPTVDVALLTKDGAVLQVRVPEGVSQLAPDFESFIRDDIARIAAGCGASIGPNPLASGST